MRRDPIVVALRDARTQRGWTQQQIAAAIGRGTVTITTWETGRRNPTLHSVREWAHALGLDLVLAPQVPGPAASDNAHGRAGPNVPAGAPPATPAGT